MSIEIIERRPLIGYHVLIAKHAATRGILREMGRLSTSELFGNLVRSTGPLIRRTTTKVMVRGF